MTPSFCGGQSRKVILGQLFALVPKLVFHPHVQLCNLKLKVYPLKEFPELIHCEKQLNPNMWFDIVNIIKPETTKMALICYHKNWKILSSPDSRMAEPEKV